MSQTALADERVPVRDYTLDRSARVRANIKRYYIYVVLALIVLVFSLLKLDEVSFFGRGHFLSPDSVINLLRTAAPILTLSGAFTLLMISGYIDLSVGSAMTVSYTHLTLPTIYSV